MRHAIENFTCPKGSLDLDRNTVNEITEDTVSTIGAGAVQTSKRYYEVVIRL